MDELTVQAARDLIMESDIPAMSEVALGGGDFDEAGLAEGADLAGASDALAGATSHEAASQDGLQDELGDLPGKGGAAGEGGVAGADQARAYGDGQVGLGVDIVEIERMKGLIARTPSFVDKVFSPEECAYCRKTAQPATHFALRFAAKEAVVKALGVGFADGISVRDIEVVRAKNGKPSVRLSGRAAEIADAQKVRDLSISLSYTRNDAVACAMAVTESAVRATEKRKDPMEELARQFKETRKILDDL